MARENLWRLMLMVIAFATAGLWLSSCGREQPAPERSFTTLELLVNLSDMPPGWEIWRGPGKGVDYISPKDGSEVVFVVNDESVPAGRQGAMHGAYRYRSAEAARGVYEDLVLPGQVGKIPAKWTYQSPIADQSYFACYDYEGREPYPICEWSARYEEYVVVFQAWLIPGYMTLTDVERVVRAIDARMAEYLGKSLPTDAP